MSLLRQRTPAPDAVRCEARTGAGTRCFLTGSTGYQGRRLCLPHLRSAHVEMFDDPVNAPPARETCEALVGSKSTNVGKRCTFAATVDHADGRRVCVRHTDSFREARAEEHAGVAPETKNVPQVRLPRAGGRSLPLEARGFRATAGWEPRREAIVVDLEIDGRAFSVHVPLRALFAAQEAR